MNKAGWFLECRLRVKTQDQGIRWFCTVWVQQSFVGRNYLFGGSNYVYRYWVEKPFNWEMLI